jgi:hypothetical protein
VAPGMIVFCTTCKNRTQHLKITLPRNLADNADHQNSKFLILDYGSTDELLDYLKSTYPEAIASGRLVVYSYRYLGPFHMTHAKNMAHRLGILEGADILVNLDADNYTGPGFATYVAKQFEKRGIFLWSGIVKGLGRRFRGCSGRIVVSSQTFINAGGYDERFDTWAPDDKDFNARLQRIGYRAVEMDRKYLEAIPHGEGMRFKEYPHAHCVDEFYYKEIEITESNVTIANFGRFGRGLVFRNFSSVSICLEPIPTRIFGIGLHKTATTSLDAALKILGYDSAHWESGIHVRKIWNEMNTLGRSKTLERHYATSDLPISILYKKLDAAYPGSKFILTVRDEDIWLRSVRNHWSYTRNRFRWEWEAYPISNKIHKAVYGQTWFDETVFLARYRKHNQEVIEYFKDRREDLLLMNMDKGAGWPELCEFLGKSIPGQEYPRAFVTK